MKLSDFNESKYLGKVDVKADTVCTINGFEVVEIPGRDGKPDTVKPAVRFREFKKLLLLNKRNRSALERICGTAETDQMEGRKLIVYVDPDVEFGGQIVGGLRLRALSRAEADPVGTAKSGIGGKASKQEPDDEIPF